LTSNNSLLGKKFISQQISTFAKANLPVYFIVFFSAAVLKTVTELVAYPYPIGYDVINYYIPMLSDFENESHIILNEYPVYIYILHFVQILSGLSPQATVTSFSIFVYGIFAVSIFSVGKAIVKNDTLSAVLLSLFVIIQIPVLRTAWDLHRDMFSISMMLFAVSILIRIHNNHLSRIPLRLLLPCFSFTILSVISDRMVGGWLVLVLCIYSILSRERMVTLCTIISLGLFFMFLFITGHGNSILNSIFNDVMNLDNKVRIPGGQVLVDPAYNQTNLLVYLISMNGLLIPLAVVGFFRLKERLLRLGLIAAMIGSISWIVFPHASQLVADRWILLFGMTLSIFAGYGLITTIQRIRKSVRHHIRFTSLSIAIFVLFALLGIAYAVLSYDAQISLIGLFAKNVEKFAPNSMQFNSIRVEDSSMMLDMIDWVNTHTSTDSIILGSNHWRGWFVSGLEGNRSFVSDVGPNSSLTNAIGRYSDHFYLVDVKGKDDLNHKVLSNFYQVVNLHSNDLFSIYQLFLGGRNITSMH
jgi:hypothetical protein